MPRGDRTGPRGQGPMTGRAAGYCAGFPVPGFANGGPGAGFGWGTGRGGGWGRGRGGGWGRGRGGGWGTGWGTGRMYPATGPQGWAGAWPAGAGYAPPFQGPAPEDELTALANQAQAMTEALKSIQNRIAELEKGDNGDK